jgi:hypothetical protein
MSSETQQTLDAILIAVQGISIKQQELEAKVRE